MMRIKITGILLITGLIGVIYGLTSIPSPAQRGAMLEPSPVPWKVEAIAEGLKIPWALAFSRDGKIFFTERIGRLSVLEKIGEKPRILAEIPDVAASGHAQFATGLLGLALDPSYPQEPYLYVYYTYKEGENLLNRLVRFKEVEDRAVEDGVLLDKIPGSSWQNGGRIEFGPDGKLYVPTGGGKGGPKVDSVGEQLRGGFRGVGFEVDQEAQDINSLACKILRINRDGTVPADNPFPQSPVYSYGHRHSQGLAWHPVTGKLYITEHGPPGGWDEINLVEAGRNYGWPRFKGHTAYTASSWTLFKPQYVRPLAVYTPAIAPSGASFYSGKVFPQWKNSLFFVTLGAPHRGQHLHRLELSVDGRSVRREERLLEDTYGRLRAVVEGPDGFLYLSTSNRDQSGTPVQNDDRILRIVPSK
jgi:glucose/arabinose dehydrogenase